MSRIITEGHECFHQEKELITEAKQRSYYLQTDDTGARHKGQNGYCTFIGNELFSYFKSTSSKIRINFLQILNGQSGYVFNEYALKYIADHSLAPKYLKALEKIKGASFEDTKKFTVAFIGQPKACSQNHNQSRALRPFG